MSADSWKITAANFKTNFSELNFEGVDDATVDRFLYQARQFHKYSGQATQYCAAHLFSLWRLSKANAEAEAPTVDGGGGEVTKDQIGSQIQEYKTQAEKGREVFFSTTSYGRHFLVLEKRTPQYVLGGILIGK